MKKVLMTASFGLALVLGASCAQAQLTDKGPVVQNSNAMAAADQADMMKSPIRQQIQDQMTKAGFTDVSVMPSSFYVRAKDKKGDPVAMVIGPDSVTEVTELAPPKATNGAGSGGSSSTSTTKP